MPTFGDTAYKSEDLVNIVNSHLADGFGNLLSRVITLAGKKDIVLEDDILLCSSNTVDILRENNSRIKECFDKYQLYDGAGAIHNLTIFANQHINAIKPWDKECDPAVASQCLVDLGVILYALVKYYSLIIPTMAAKAKNMLDTMTKEVLFTKIV